MNFFFIFLFFLTINFSLSTKVISKESWLLDKNLSSIEFELPVLFANNVQGKFEEINGTPVDIYSNIFIGDIHCAVSIPLTPIDTDFW